MKKVILWRLIILAFVCTISAGLILVHFAMNARDVSTFIKLLR